jgi:4-amino-4-deoxy-L-arabinose transferase-like glycosyltransferase
MSEVRMGGVQAVTDAVRAPPRWGARIFLLALALGLLMVFVVFGSQSMVSNRFDPYFFGEMGKSLARGEGFAAYGSLIKRRAPLYPMAIGAIYSLFGERPVLVQIFQCLLLAGTCALVYDLGRRIFNQRTAIVAGVACALHPMMLRYVPDLHLETMFTFLCTLMVWSMVRFSEDPSGRNGALTGAVAGLASLTKAVFFPYPVLFAAAIFWLRRRAGRPLPWAGLAALFAVMAAIILPWTARNYRATGHVVPISSGMSDAFLRGYVFSKPDYALLRKPPYTDAENESNAYFRSLCEKAGTVWERDDYETDQILNKEMKARLRAEPMAFVRKFAVGLFTFWYELTNLANSLLVGALAAIALGFAFVGWRHARREGRPAWVLLLPALYLNLLLAALLALGRYSAPILPGLLVVAAYGVDRLLAAREARRA